MKLGTKSVLVGSALLGVLLAADPASACGGFFCNQAQPINQAAERIIFADNGDGTQTAVIEIMYQGPSENFSWLLPISSVPMGDEIAVASSLALQRLQTATNPNYTLTTRIEGTCKDEPIPPSRGGGPILTDASPSVDAGADHGVTVEASGIVGSFEWTVISFDDALSDPADAAVTWLNDNGYDVPAGAPALLGPYLEGGLNLLALKLTKGSDAGSIRPIMLTYEADRPMIPVKLTAVAANENMGVMAWVLSDSRAVPQNYLSLELNEARINWFNASLNYNDVVSEAANDAQGQGFVTEFAQPSSSVAEVAWSADDESLWQSFRMNQYQSFSEMLLASRGRYSTYDGYWDAVQASVTLPDGVSFADFKACMECYQQDATLSPAEFIANIEKGVVEPMRAVQRLIDAHPMITRLYTTMSAEEMTLDPLFTFNPDLATVSNLHTAERVIECEPNLGQSQANWRIELPQGGVVRGSAADVGTWPAALAAQPPNRKIVRDGETGAGKTLEDNGPDIEASLEAYNDTVPAPAGTGTGGAAAGGGNSGGMLGSSADTENGSENNGCACATTTRGGASSLFAAAAALALLGLRKRSARRSASSSRG